MKPVTLALCLIAGLAASGCVIHHTETIPARHEQKDDHTRPAGVAMAPAAADTGSAR